MALEKGVNSYVSVAEFNTYLSDRLDVDAASSADDVRKAASLVSATDILNGMNWTGIVLDNSQDLAFPRSGSYFDPRIGGRVYMSEEIPKRIIQATFELAYHLLLNPNVQDSTGQLKNLSVASIHLEFMIDAPKVPLKVKNIVRPLLINSGSSPWWRAN